MAFTNSDIRFTVLFDDVPSIRITDNIQSGYTGFGLTPSSVYIRLKVECSNGGVIYDGIGNVTDDITLAGSWYKDITTANGLKLNTSGVPVHGIYTITYNIYTVASPAESVPVATYTETHDYGYTRPTPALTLDYSCGTSKQAPYIRSKDNTEYAIFKGGINLYGTPAYTLHKFNFPVSSGQASITQAVPTAELVTGNLWTLLNTSTISSNATFTLQTQSTTTVLIQSTIQYKCYIDTETSVNVQCDECSCLYWNCFNNIYDKYYFYAGKDQIQSNKYKSILQEISFNYAYYHQANNCGEDSTKYCTKLKELAVSENCSCNESQTKSQKISPVNNTNLTYVIDGFVDGNGYLNLEYSDGNTEIKQKVTGADGADGAAGAAGAAGANGAAGVDGADGVSTITADMDVAFISLVDDNWTTIKTISYSSDLFENLGDGIKFKSIVKVNSGDSQCIKYRVQINGTTVGQTDLMDLNVQYANLVWEIINVFDSPLSYKSLYYDILYTKNESVKNNSFSSSLGYPYSDTIITLEAFKDANISSVPAQIRTVLATVIKYKGGII